MAKHQETRDYDVFQHGKLVDTVFAKGYDAESMRRSLIDHDAYPSDITVKRRAPQPAASRGRRYDDVATSSGRSFAAPYARERRAYPSLLKLSYDDPDMEHELYRISYMDDLALIRRMDKIRTTQKLFNFYRALKKDRHSGLAKIVARKLQQEGYGTDGEPY